ncbi:hypothetical protein K461DRAFT_231286 [Myriangium duriaei CBS 260.36]|uniref:Class E vacuolar protein-sorting machinery protein HSE1 n=1 Tax=Myriangium duriaei CBS 260.36 TaxID=1168546 RepID=A0A9P4IX14_9PEZI|nr:hypothetical protein K461DRAFT_231286 [Myriangium duriaei CBS 260.36]
MFRAQANQFDEAVAKATDENLTSENWSLILDVCDRVSASPTGPQSVVAALIKRLAHRNANVQLYTLELANALSQNCGPPLHRELSSRSFTEALARLANDRNSHQQVKSKVLERLEGWTEQFKGDPDLGIMEQAYEKLKRSNPTLLPPSKPVKREIEDVDRRKEDEELQMALALSLRDKGPAEEDKSKTETNTNSAPPPSQGTTAATVSRVRALYDFAPSEAGELAFRKGDVIAVLESVYKDWWKGSLRGNTGIFPLNYVEKLQDPTKEELEKDAVMEAEVFAQIRNVEKLLALLSVRGDSGMGGAKDSGSEEEITELYSQTLAIRPKLIELIGKYSQKKDDFTQLNEKFIKARRDYEALLESSMSQPPAGYGYPQGRHPSQGYPGPYGQPPPGAGYPSQQTPQPYQQRPPQQQQYYPPQHTPGAPPSDPYAPVNGNSASASAAFHFIPAGAAPPPDNASATPKPLAAGHSEPPYSTQHNPQFANRPQSIHTLNSGNPQELATGGYESPIDNRQSYPPAQQLPPSQAQQQQQSQPYAPSEAQYNGVPPQQHGYPPQQLPLQQKQQGQYAAYHPQQQQQHAYPGQPSQIPSTPGGQPPHPASGAGQYPPSEVGGEDVSDYYR